MGRCQLGYDSGLVAGAVPVSDGGDVDIAGSGLTPDQQFQAGFTCNGVAATPTVGLPPTRPGNQFKSNLVKIPAPGTENDDKNLPRIAPRHLFGREKKCIAGFQPAKVVLTQKELSRLRCRRDAGATIFSHDL